MLSNALDWLLTPISGAMSHSISWPAMWHGRIQVFVWLLLIPAGLIIARFYKITARQDWPRVLDNPFWFINHRRWGYIAAALTAFAIALIVLSDDVARIGGSWHSVLGWSAAATMCVQILSALLRGTHGGPRNPFTGQIKPREEWPGDHFCMMRRRIVFDYVHKYVGYLNVMLALLAIFTGLYDVDAPRWMWVGALMSLIVFAAVFGWQQSRGRCIDTYQAIWGLDPELPGNKRRKPIGLAIRRMSIKSQ